MNRKNGTLGIALVLFAAVFIFGGCQQPVTTGNGSDRDGAFEKDSLLIEVWDSSTPPKFLGYDTGLARENYPPIILTSKGYCVELRHRSFHDENGISSAKISYGQVAEPNYYLDDDQRNEISKKDGWGYAIFFTTASTPTANDTPYAGGSNIVNNVIYNPHNGGTYYTVDRNASLPNATIQADYKFYDNTGTIRTWNDDVSLGEYDFRDGTKSSIGKPFYFRPLKKIGGYAELGLPNPATVTRGLVYKVK